jgi:hypothetical protein
MMAPNKQTLTTPIIDHTTRAPIIEPMPAPIIEHTMIAPIEPTMAPI